MKYLIALTCTLTLTLAQAVSIKHDLGTTEVPLHPKRVVVLEYSFLDMLTVLHEKPVGAARESILPSYLAPQFAGVADLGSRRQPSLEAIARLKPDLIIADTFRNKTVYPQLQKIAPTIVLDSYNGTYRDMTEQFLKVASIFGKQNVAQHYLSDQASAFKKLQVLGRGKGNVMIGLIEATSVGVTAVTQGGFTSSLFEMAGRPNVVPHPAASVSTWEPISLDGISALNPDSIVLMAFPEDRNLVDAYAKQPLWGRLKAVQSGHLYNVDRGLWALGRGPLAAQEMLAEMAKGIISNRPVR